MQRLFGQGLAAICLETGDLVASLHADERTGQGLTEADRQGIQSRLRKIHKAFNHKILSLSLERQLQRMIERSGYPNCHQSELSILGREFSENLTTELESHIFLMIPPNERYLYEQLSPPFGTEVDNNFPSASEDIAAASRCLALEEGTACVFHMMRAMEVALRVLMVDMAEPYDPKIHTDWSVILSKCNQHIGKAGAKQNFYRDAITMLTSVKWSWRNPTMHPTNTYTPNMARDVWESSRIFINHLATQLAE